MDDELSPKQEAFVLAYLRSFNGSEAAREAGYAHAGPEATRLLKNPKVKARIHEHLDAIRETGIANKAVRIAELNNLYQDLQFIKNSRIKEAKLRYENGEDIPEGAESGLLVEQTKQVGTGNNAVITQEWSFDERLFNAFVKAQEQAAKEVGDRTKQIEITGSGGGPVQVESAKSKLMDLAKESKPQPLGRETDE